MKTRILIIWWAFFALPACAQEVTKATEGYAQAEGVKIYYQVFGKGTPLLIINGGPGGNSEGFATLASWLGEKYQAIIFDQRGTGKSTLPALNTETITMDLMREDMEALRKHLNIDKWVIFGQSFGGIMASYYAVKYPEKIHGIIYSASGGLDLALRNSIQNRIGELLTPQEREELTYYNQKIDSGDTTLATRQKRAFVLASAYIVHKKYQQTIADRILQINMQINGIVWQDLLKINYDCKEALKKFTAPVLILQGRQDIIEVSIAQTAHKTLPNSKLVLLDQCSHYGWLDAKEEYLGALHKFMKKFGQK
jgi:proline iminopeptidase